MSEHKHTPGPWVLDETSPTSRRIYANEVDRRNEQILATVSAHQWYEEGLANARLIAAAPDLLAACEKLAAIEDVQDVNDARDMARAAIAKVKGGAA
jgi:hypothetical protein